MFEIQEKICENEKNMERTIDECFFQIQNGANIKQGDVDGGYPITRIETTANDKFNRNRMGYAGITDISKYESYILEDGDLLMSHINSVQYLGRTVLYVKQPKETIIHGMNLLRLKARRDIINPAYARYCFYGQPFRKQVGNITKKSVNQASFAVKDLKQIKIDIPTLAEQGEVVKILDKIQKIIEIEKEKMKKLDGLIKARFVELFVGKGYPVIPVKDLLVQNSTVEKISHTKAEKFVTVGIKGRGARQRVIKDGKWPVPFSGYRVKQGQFIYSRIDARNGAFAILPQEVDNAVVSKDFPVFDIKTDKIQPAVLLFSVLQDDFIKQIQNSSFGATNRQRIQEYVFGEYTITLPPMEVQNEFSDFVEQVDKSKVEVQKSLEKMQLLFDSLMQEYFG